MNTPVPLDHAGVTFGLYVENLHPKGEDLGVRLEEHRKQIELARNAGFRSIVFGQHLLTEPIQMPAPLSHLASVIDISGSMWLCTGVLLLPLLQPVLLAEELASIDWLSGGRLVIGVGLGYREEEYLAAGVEMKERVSRFNEALQVMKAVWSAEETWSFYGKRYRYEGLPAGLTPKQQPHPSIWVAADADTAVRRAGRLGASWYINPRANLDTLRRQLQVYEQAITENGHDRPAVFPIRREAFLAATDREANQMAVRYLKRQLELYKHWGQYEVMPDSDPNDIDFDEDRVPETYLVGTPERVAELIQRYIDQLGVNHFVLRVQWPGTPPDLVLKTIEMVGDMLIPAFGSGSTQGVK